MNKKSDRRWRKKIEQWDEVGVKVEVGMVELMVVVVEMVVVVVLMEEVAVMEEGL